MVSRPNVLPRLPYAGRGRLLMELKVLKLS